MWWNRVFDRLVAVAIAAIGVLIALVALPQSAAAALGPWLRWFIGFCAIVALGGLVGAVVEIVGAWNRRKIGPLEQLLREGKALSARATGMDQSNTFNEVYPDYLAWSDAVYAALSPVRQEDARLFREHDLRSDAAEASWAHLVRTRIDLQVTYLEAVVEQMKSGDAHTHGRRHRSHQK